MKKDRKKRKKDKAREGASAARAVASAREAVTRAAQKLDDRLAALQRVADALEAAAVERFRSEAVIALRDEQILRDLADLRTAFAARGAPALPAEIEPFRHLPEAVLRFLQERFGLTPHLEAGRDLQMPSEKLRDFALEDDRGDPPSGVLVRVRVLAPGWKRGDEVVVPPRVELVE
jgi:hypothetical protein